MFVDVCVVEEEGGVEGVSMYVEIGDGAGFTIGGQQWGVCVHVRTHLVEEGPDDVDEHLPVALHALLACLFAWGREG